MWQEVFGWIATGMSSIGFVSQLIKIIKEKTTEGLSKVTLASTFLSAVIWFSSGVLTSKWQEIITSFVMVGALIIGAIKFIWHSDRKLYWSMWLMGALILSSGLAIAFSVLPSFIFSSHDSETGAIISKITSVTILLSFIPQLFKTIKNKTVISISLPFLLLYGFSQIPWIIHRAGLIKNSGDPLEQIMWIVSAAITLLIYIVMIFYKLKESKVNKPSVMK